MVATVAQNTHQTAQDAPWIAKLKARGVYEAAIELGAFPAKMAGRPGWQYPVFGEDGQPYLIRENMPIERWKALDSSAVPKYLWNLKDPADGKPWPVPPYYLPPGFPEAVKRAEGVAIWSSGEMDGWTYVQNGIRNVFSWYGESSGIPDTLVADLERWGVDMVLMYPDLDKTGQTAAAKVHSILNGKIPHRIYILPESLGLGGDINKAWQAAEFDPKRWANLLAQSKVVDRSIPEFDPALAELKAKCSSYGAAYDAVGGNLETYWRLVIHAEHYPAQVDRKPSPSNHAASPDRTAEFEALKDEYHRDIAARLDPGMEFDADGWSRKPFACPMASHQHDDTSPAAHWNRDMSILKCFKCGNEAFLAKDVAKAIGLDWANYAARLPAWTPPAKTEQAEPAKDKPKRALFIDTRSVDLAQQGSYLPMQFRSIREFGGFAERMSFNKMSVLAAPSGNSKTTFVESLAARARRSGYSVIEYSPEWTPLEKLWREIQRCGGPSMSACAKHQAYWTDRESGVSHDICIGEGKVPLSDRDLALRDEKKREIESWPGRSYLVPPGSFSDVLEGIEAARAQSVKDGAPAWLWIMDYIQLFTQEYAEIMQYATALKDYTMRTPIHGLVVSQMLKSASAAARSGNDLTSEGMELLKENVFNLALLSRRQYDEDTGEALPGLVVKVAKNSDGVTGDVTMDLTPHRLLVTDRLDRQHVI